VSAPAPSLVLLRHGQSEWNRDRRFTGWTDVALSPRGELEAERAGRLLRAEGHGFDVVFTSVLARAIRTVELVLAAMGNPDVPVERSWRLNERHYGALQGMRKPEAVRRFGVERVSLWQRSFDEPPPPLGADDPRLPARDPLYAALSPGELPSTESLRHTQARLLPCWEEAIVPALRGGRRVLVVAHWNSLRGLVQHLSRVPVDEIPRLAIPTGEPFAYDFDADLRPLGRRYLRRTPGFVLGQWAKQAWLERAVRARMASQGAR
jgi:2,3-bisphosphoglycerate-dependent phosphoglycerate mutase